MTPRSHSYVRQNRSVITKLLDKLSDSIVQEVLTQLRNNLF